MEGLVVLAVFVGLAILLLKLNDGLRAFAWRVKNPPEKISADRERLFARIESPDWSFYEEHLQRPVPPTLREAFSSKERLRKSHYFKSYYVAFAPVDRAALAENWVMQGIVPFADSDGDPIFLKPGPSELNVVHIAYHDGGGTEALAPDVEAFLDGLRVGA